MAPTKILIEQQQQQQPKIIQKTVMTKTTGKILTRSQANFPKKVTTKDMTKRKADQLSPPKGKTTKRSALNESTNFASKHTNVQKKPPVLKKPVVTATISQKSKEVSKIVSTVQSKIAVYVDSKSSITIKTGEILKRFVICFVLNNQHHSQFILFSLLFRCTKQRKCGSDCQKTY